jgi:MFS family permease
MWWWAISARLAKCCCGAGLVKRVKQWRHRRRRSREGSVASVSESTLLTLPEDPSRSAFLINRNFALLWGGQVISTIGDYVFTTTVLLWITQRLALGAAWAPLAVSGELIAITVPTVMLGPFAGVFVDRWDKRETMLRMDFFRSLLLLALVPLAISAAPLGVFLSTSWLLGVLYATLALVITCSQFFGPARLSLINAIVPMEQQARASSLVFMTLSVGVVIGPAVAAWLFFAAGPVWALVLDSLSFLISFLAIRSIRTVRTGTSRGAVSVGPRNHLAVRQFLGEFTKGARYFWSNRILRTLTIVTSIALLGASAINTLGIFFLTDNLGKPPQWFGLLEAASGVGILLGSIGATWIVPRLGVARSFWLSTALTGLLLMLYARQTSYAVALALLVVIGLPSAGLNVAIGPLLLQATPPDLVGRAVAQLAPTTNLAALLSTALVGYFATTILRGFHLRILSVSFGPYDTIYLLGGLVITAAGVFAWAGLRATGVDLSSRPARSRNRLEQNL